MKRLLCLGAVGAMGGVALMQRIDVPWDPGLLVGVPLQLALVVMALDPAVQDRERQLSPYLVYVALAGLVVAATQPSHFLPNFLETDSSSVLFAAATGATLVGLVFVRYAYEKHGASRSEARPLDHPTHAVYLAAAIAALALVGYADSRLDTHFALEFLYLVPVLAAAWGTGMWGGVAVAIVATNAYVLIASSSAGSAVTPWARSFNALLMQATLLSAALLLAKLHTLLRRERSAARHDQLTGLLNRAAFVDAAKAEQARCRRSGAACTVAYIDLDGFKGVNDTLGHAVGDGVLRTVGAVLRSRLRETDVAARLGGDEFALLLTGCNTSQAAGVLDNLRSVLLDSMERQGWAVTFSIGGVSDVAGSRSVEQLIARADEVMYWVKRSGKNDLRLLSAAEAHVARECSAVVAHGCRPETHYTS